MTENRVEELYKSLRALESRLVGYVGAFRLAASNMEKVRGQKSGEEWLTPWQAVRRNYFGSEKTASNLRHEGKGPTYHKTNNGRVLYLRADLEEWVRSFRVEPREADLPAAVRENKELFQSLRSVGISLARAARTVGISTTTARRWEKRGIS